MANRHRFQPQLRREIERTARYGHPFCLLVVNIDDFKKINDTFGHKIGDLAICHLAKALQEGIRSTDLAARIGGDEFALLLPETGVDKGLEIGQRLRHAIKGTGIPTAGSVTTTIRARVGITESLSGAQTMEELLDCADQALYEAKNQGGDRVIQDKSSRRNQRGVQRYTGINASTRRAKSL